MHDSPQQQPTPPVVQPLRTSRLRMPAWAIWLVIVLSLLHLLVPTGYMLYRSWRTNWGYPEKLPPPFLDFASIEARYPQVCQGMTQEEIEAILGTPTHRESPIEFAARVSQDERLGEHWRTKQGERFHLWIDPEQSHRLILVRYGGDDVESDRASLVTKTGF